MTEPARPTDDPQQLWPAQLDGQYELIGEQGRGGMAVVFRARDRELGREVAVKVVRPRFAADAEAVARLAREARTVAQLEHPNIVGVYSIRHLDDGSVALVMQLVPGRTLKQAVTEDGPFSVERAEHVLRDVSRALAYAHRAGVVHRDVKPENIFLDDVSGRAMLSDFGVARVMDAPTELTATGTTIGTPTYMAPEQIDGVQLDGRSDLYSLGMVGWEMLSGERPWSGESLYSVIYRQKHDQLTPIDAYRDDVPPRLQYLIEGLMPKNADRRWASAARFLTLLASDGPLPGYKEWESAQRRRRRTRVFRQARLRGDSVIGAALETVKFSRPPTPVGPLAGIPATGTPRSTPAIDSPIAGEQPGSAPPHESAPAAGVAAPTTVRRPTPARTPPGRRTPIGSGASPTPSGGYSIKRLPGDPASYTPSGGIISVPVQRPNWTLRVLMAVAIAAGGMAYWWFNYGPGATQQTPVVNIIVDPTDRPGIELPVIATKDSAPPTSDSAAAPSAAPVAAQTTTTPGLRPNQDSARLASPAPPARDRTVTVAAAGTTRSAPSTRADSLAAPVSPPVVLSPPPVVPALTFPQDRGNIAAGGSHSCLLDNTGRASCWGSNDAGQLGDGTYQTRPSPDRVLGDFTFSLLTAGFEHTCGLTIGNEVFCWGQNTSGQLGDGQTTARTAPVRLNSTVSFRLIRAGRAHTCGLSNSGTVFCWGRNTEGQLGDRTRVGRTSPVMVDLPASASALSVGWDHSCALTHDGTAYCWGRNDFGQLGDGSTTVRTAPVRVRTTEPMVSIATGLSHSCAVGRNEKAMCWGRNHNGQAGVEGEEIVLEPREVAGRLSFSTIVAGSVHTCARARDGSGWCWGLNTYGQLGNGSTSRSTVPVQIRGVTRLEALNASAAHTCATGAGDDAWCWGYNVNGQLGRGDKMPASTPIRVTSPPR